MHKLIGEDLYSLGKQELAKEDIVSVRNEERARRAEKSRLRRCILNGIRESRMSSGAVTVGVCKNTFLSSQKWVRRHPNNLGLTI